MPDTDFPRFLGKVDANWEKCGAEVFVLDTLLRNFNDKRQIKESCDNFLTCYVECGEEVIKAHQTALADNSVNVDFDKDAVDRLRHRVSKIRGVLSNGGLPADLNLEKMRYLFAYVLTDIKTRHKRNEPANLGEIAQGFLEFITKNANVGQAAGVSA